jgi:hypothetical protein
MERLGTKSTKAEFMTVLHWCDLDMKKRRSGFKVEWAHDEKALIGACVQVTVSFAPTPAKVRAGIRSA